MLVPRFFYPQKPLAYGIGHGSIIERKNRADDFIAAKSNFIVVVVHAVERDSQEFEIDTDKAKEALQQLDHQLQSLSDKKISSPKIKASDVRLRKDRMMAEEPPEITGSFLAYSAFVLLAFTFFYNVLFYSVIKPSIDGPEPVSELRPESCFKIAEAF